MSAKKSRTVRHRRSRPRGPNPTRPSPRDERLHLYYQMNEKLGFPLTWDAWDRIVKKSKVKTDFAFIAGDLDTAVADTLCDDVARLALGTSWPRIFQSWSEIELAHWYVSLFFACVRKRWVEPGGKLTIAYPRPDVRRRRRMTSCANLA